MIATTAASNTIMRSCVSKVHTMRNAQRIHSAVRIHNAAAARSLSSAAPLISALLHNVASPSSSLSSSSSILTPLHHTRLYHSHTSPQSPSLHHTLIPSDAALTPNTVYRSAIAAGELREDERQKVAVQLLEDLFQKLLAAKQNGGAAPSSYSEPEPVAEEEPAKSSGGFFGFASKLFGSNKSSSSSSSSSYSSSSASSSSPFHGILGLYLHGGVGSGKTMLMNSFVDCVRLRVTEKTKRRHFLEFMLDIHRRLHELRTKSRSSNSTIQDPISIIARAYAQECEVLALDEFQVTDVADAMILQGLFNELWKCGCVLVATSNRPPEELYKNGINRIVFEPFIPALRKHCQVHNIEDGQDYRLLGTIAEGVYHTPINAATNKALDATFTRIAGVDTKIGPQTISVMMGRTLKVQRGAANFLICRFTFSELCETSIGAADYLALVQAYKYIIIDNIPILYFHEREKMRRFITFLDVAYEQKTRLIMQAAEVPLKLFQVNQAEMNAGQKPQQQQEGEEVREFEGGAPSKTTTTTTEASRSSKSRMAASAGAPVGGATSASTTAGAKYDEQFASSRAISRLIEMTSEQYLRACAKERDGPQTPKL